MYTTLVVALSILGTVFVGSFAILVVLCRYKSLRKRTAVYVKRLARNELRNFEGVMSLSTNGIPVNKMSRSDIELIDKEDTGRLWDQDDQQTGDRLARKCSALLKLCDTVDLKQLGPSDISKLHHIVQMAHRIFEETNSNDSEKLRLMETNTTALLLNVSKALTKMEQHLTRKETSLKHLDALYHSSSII